MTYDCGAAAKRHFSDAEYLEEGGAARRGNADQLYGFAAECGLLRILVHFGVPVGPGGDVDDGGYRKHIDTLWGPAMMFLEGREGGNVLAKIRPPGGANPFGDWRTRQRYEARGAEDNTRVAAHRRVARSVVEQLDGLATPPKRGGK